MEGSDFVLVGRIRKAQGIRGEVTVEALTDEPEAVFAAGRRLYAGTVDGDLARDPDDRDNAASRQAVVIQSASPFKGGYIVKLDVVTDRTGAELWRQRYLLAPRAELTPPSEGEVYVHDLVGMHVCGADGSEIGRVVGYYELPQGLTLEVSTAASSVLVPYRPEMVLQVDTAARSIIVDTASGLFD